MLKPTEKWVNHPSSANNFIMTLRPFPIEYWLASLKVATILIFIIIGILVNIGVNHEHHFIGGHYWRIPGAPFVGGFGGFAKVFVTASYACECDYNTGLFVIGLFEKLLSLYMKIHIVVGSRWRDRKFGNHCRRDRESIEEHAESSQTGFLEVRAPVFETCLFPTPSDDRILLFYILSILLISLNGEWNCNKCRHCFDASYHSTVGLPQPIQQEYGHVSLYHSIPRNRLKYVNSCSEIERGQS